MEATEVMTMTLSSLLRHVVQQDNLERRGFMTHCDLREVIAGHIFFTVFTMENRGIRGVHTFDSSRGWIGSNLI